MERIIMMLLEGYIEIEDVPIWLLEKIRDHLITFGIYPENEDHVTLYEEICDVVGDVHENS